MLKQSIALATCAVLTGCATSREARELAVDTAAAIQTLDAELARNAIATKAGTDAALGRVTYLTRRTAESQADLQAEIDASRSKADYTALRDFAEKQEQERQKNLRAIDDAAMARADSIQQWKAPSAMLRQMSDSYTALGRKENVWSRLQFTGSFVKAVADRVKQNRKDADANQKSAEATATQQAAKSEAGVAVTK